MKTKLHEITHENSTVDGSVWEADRFAALDFGAELYTDPGYSVGCIKYVPCAEDDDPTMGHRVRSTFAHAQPVQVDGRWMWKVYGLPEQEEKEKESK